MDIQNYSLCKLFKTRIPILEIINTKAPKRVVKKDVFNPTAKAALLTLVILSTESKVDINPSIEAKKPNTKPKEYRKS